MVHHAGDAAAIPGRITARHTRSMDIACRYGGEEFLLVLSNTSLEIAAHRAENYARLYQSVTSRQNI